MGCSESNNCFQPETAAKVLKTIISLGDHEDKLIWEKEKYGEYGVKSAYKLLCDVKKGNQEGESSRIASQKWVWKEIWKLRVPNKVKVFLLESM